MKRFSGLFSFVVLLFLVTASSAVWAHCDTLSGPVIQDAKLALERKDVTPVLKWIGKDDEREIRPLFQRTLAVRAKSEEARNLADMYFFETLVRIHRAGEGAPYTGLKATETPEPAIEMADKSIEKNSAAEVLRSMNRQLDDGIRTRFQKVVETKKHAADSVEAGRAYVAAYVDYMHFVESVNTLLTTKIRFDHGNEVTHVKDKSERHR